MRPTRTVLLSSLLLSVLVAAMTACGGSSTASSDAAASASLSTESTGGEPSEPASASASAATSDGGGAVTADLDQLIDALTPPNANQTSRFDVEGGVTISYDSTSSLDDLRSHYEDKVADLGFEVITSGEQSGAFSMVFGDPSGATDAGGSVAIAPGTSGSGSTVIVILAGEGG